MSIRSPIERELPKDSIQKRFAALMGRNGELFYVKSFDRNNIKCRALNRKPMLGNVHCQFTKESFSFARNCVKFPDLYRKVRFTIASPHWVG